MCTCLICLAVLCTCTVFNLMVTKMGDDNNELHKYIHNNKDSKELMEKDLASHV